MHVNGVICGVEKKSIALTRCNAHGRFDACVLVALSGGLLLLLVGQIWTHCCQLVLLCPMLMFRPELHAHEACKTAGHVLVCSSLSSSNYLPAMLYSQQHLGSACLQASKASRQQAAQRIAAGSTAVH